MKLNEIVVEMVQRIVPFKLAQLENIRENRKIFRNITQFTPKVQKIQTFDTGIVLYKLDKGQETEFYGMDLEDKFVAYYMRFEIQNAQFVDTSWCTQVMVWRGHLSANKSKGIPEKVFYDYVLDKFGVAVTDGEQTPDGERFWKQRIIEAFANSKLKVYILDFNKKTCRLLQKSEYVKILNTPDDPWGNSAWHKGVRLAISDFDLVQE
jgi:hypothetical protein